METAKIQDGAVTPSKLDVATFTQPAAGLTGNFYGRRAGRTVQISYDLTGTSSSDSITLDIPAGFKPVTDGALIVASESQTGGSASPFYITVSTGVIRRPTQTGVTRRFGSFTYTV